MEKLSFTPMAPQWIAFPAYTEFTIGWRMGAGEDYKSKFWDWYESLTPAQQKEYQALFPYPCFWHYNRWEEDDQDIDDEEDYYYEGIPIWQPKGAYKYSKATFINSPKKLKFVFFWKPNTEVVDESCFAYSGLTLNQYGVTSPCPDLNLIHYIRRKRKKRSSENGFRFI